MKHKPWFEVLLAARRISERGEPLMSTTLGLECGIDTRVASAWLFKFEKWNYVLRSEKDRTGRRWSWSWTLTKWGLTYKASEKRKARLRIAANPRDNQG